MLLDAGVVYLNYGEAEERVLGATSGGNGFVVSREIKEIEVDGSKGKTKGFRRIITENATLTTNLKELSAENIKIALAGSTSTVDGTTQDETIKSTGQIVDADYLKNVALVTTISGDSKPVVIKIYNALSDGDLDITTSDKDEAVVELQLSAHYDPADLTKEIYDITYPNIA